MTKKINVVTVVINCIVALSVMCLIYYIFNYSEMFFHSDAATVVLLAKERLESGQYFPDGFCYSTGMFIISLANVIQVLMLFIEDWLLCREISQLIFAIIIFGLFFLFYRQFEDRDKFKYAPYIAIILMCLPLGHYAEYFYAAAYNVTPIVELLILTLISMCLKKSTSKWNYIFLFFVIFISHIGGISGYATKIVPILCALLIYAFIEYMQKEKNILKERRVIWTISTVVCGAILSYFTYKYLEKALELSHSTGGRTFTALASQNLKQLPDIWLNFFCAQNSCELLSLEGLTVCANFVIFVLVTFIVPILALVYYNKIKDRVLKIYILYALVSDFIALYMMFFTTAIEGAARYYHTIFFHHITLTALFISYLLNHKVKIVKYIFVCAIVIATLLNHITYMNTNDSKKKTYEEKNEYSLVDYLQENELTYGYSTFWTAYKNMVLSNGELTIAALIDNSTKPYYWLTSKEWYDTDIYNGRCFYVAGKNSNIDEQLLDVAVEIKYFEDYIILIFDKNVLEYEFTEANRNIYTDNEILLSSLIISDNTYRTDEKIVFKPSGMQYGPYIALGEGVYEISIQGSNLSMLETKITISAGQEEVIYDVKQLDDDVIVLEFVLESYCEGFEIANYNLSEEVITINSIEINKND